jgi:hypothetical protein
VDYPSPELVSVEGGSVELGKPRGFPSFGWDNEYGHKKMDIQVKAPHRAGKGECGGGGGW